MHEKGSMAIKASRVWGFLLLLWACSIRGGQGYTSENGERSRSVTKPISFAILEDYDKGADLGKVARDFARFRELGVPVWRGSFGWDD